LASWDEKAKSPLTDDPFHLARFVSAQADTFSDALEELKSGRKRTHWMWFIFPQLRGLGLSQKAQFYGLVSLSEAQAYLRHPVLGARLLESVAATLTAPTTSLSALFGSPDDLKFCSSMTLFSVAAPGGIYQEAIDRLCQGRPDLRTAALLDRSRA
jgi:uncharacterized protein (DUF1810 family)